MDCSTLGFPVLHYQSVSAYCLIQCKFWLNRAQMLHFQQIPRRGWHPTLAVSDPRSLSRTDFLGTIHDLTHAVFRNKHRVISEEPLDSSGSFLPTCHVCPSLPCSPTLPALLSTLLWWSRFHPKSCQWPAQVGQVPSSWPWCSSAVGGTPTPNGHFHWSHPELAIV